MNPKRIIISAVVIAVVFFAVSFLKGDLAYLHELTATTLVRSQIEGVLGALPKGEKPIIAFKFNGDPAYKEAVQKEIAGYDGVKIDASSKQILTALVDDDGKVVSSTLSLDADGKELSKETSSMRLGSWLSLLPPLLAIILAIVLRKVLLSLGLAIWLGAFLHYSLNPLKSAWYAVSHYIWGNFIGEFSLMILCFVFVLVGMVNVINRGGGMAGVVNLITKIARCARTACLSATCMGVLIFFDDYTNTIVVGTTMRSFTDKMRVSREKLAYIVDSTAAPVAGIAILSTWIGFEVLQLHKVAEFIGIGESGYSLFLHALPFRFYCIFAIFFVFLVSIMRRDFGPMLHAEQRAAQSGEVVDPDPDADHSAEPMLKAADPKEGVPERWCNAIIPVFSVILFLVIGIIWRGSSLIEKAGGQFSLFSLTSLRECFINIGGDGNTLFFIMLFAAITGSAIAALLFMAQGILNFKEIASAWLSGWRIIPAAAILILAWAIREVCDDLGTALFLSSMVKGVFNPLVLPVIIFLLSSAVSFATGTSFGTMGLLLPTVAPLAFTLGSPAIFFMSLGAVLDGAIFGDHCSPISDTTVLSSLSSSCDLSDHVRTQMPYAILCMFVAMICGYLPAAFGLSPFYLYGLGALVLISVLLVIGKNPEKQALATSLATDASSKASCKEKAQEEHTLKTCPANPQT
ncbi:MAG: Na+/H+ antiporter NhaC family protein [Pseudomonadota bacterium]